MDKIIDKLALSARFMQAKGKDFLSDYLISQMETLKKIAAGHPYVLCTYYFPSEIASMFDEPFLYIERIVGLCVGLNLLDREQARDVPINLCSYHKALLWLLESGILPMPGRMIAVHYPCRDAIALCEYLHDVHGIPLTYVSTQALEGDIKNTYDWIRSEFSQRQGIEETVALSNRAASIKREIDWYRRAYPAIVRSDDCLKLFPVENDFGNQGAVVVLRRLLDFIQARVPEYEASPASRIFWMGLVPLYDNNVLSRMERRLGCQFVYEEMWMFSSDDITSERFFEDLAIKVRTNLFYCDDQRAQRLLGAARQMEADLVIHLSHEGCSFLPAKYPKLADAFRAANIRICHIGTNAVMGDFDEEGLASLIQTNCGMGS